MLRLLQGGPFWFLSAQGFTAMMLFFLYQVHVDIHMLCKITVPDLEQDWQIICTHLKGQCAHIKYLIDPHLVSLKTNTM